MTILRLLFTSSLALLSACNTTSTFMLGNDLQIGQQNDDLSDSSLPISVADLPPIESNVFPTAPTLRQENQVAPVVSGVNSNELSTIAVQRLHADDGEMQAAAANETDTDYGNFDELFPKPRKPIWTTDQEDSATPSVTASQPAQPFRVDETPQILQSSYADIDVAAVTDSTLATTSSLDFFDGSHPVHSYQDEAFVTGANSTEDGLSAPELEVESFVAGQPCGVSCPSCNAADASPRPFHPDDEYICDGGDGSIDARIDKEWKIGGLEIEDTVGHFDTLDGRTVVEPSNRVCIYAPRFAAVRKVTGSFEDDQFVEPVPVSRPVQAQFEERDERILAIGQPIAPKLDVGVGTALVFRDRTQGVTLDNYLPVRELAEVVQGHMDIQFFQIGILKRSEKAVLAEGIESAQTWTKNAAPQVMFDAVEAVIDTTIESPGVVFVTDPGNSRLRLVKVASKDAALPGDEVEFMLRFDNTGDRAIGNVTIVDNLTTRLEYVEESAECSVDAKFDSELNIGESLKLRWEITQPLKPGEGGVIRFKCKVR